MLKHKSFLLPYIFAIITVITFLVLTVSWGNIIMGLDNASPFWGLSPVINELKHGYNFFYSGPLLLIFPINILSVLRIPATLISHLFLYFSLFSGIYGVVTLNRHLHSKQLFFAFMFAAFTLVTIWLLVNPSLLFLAAFGSIPWLVIALLVQKTKLFEKILILISFINFTATAVNPVAFALFLLQIFILVLILGSKKELKRYFTRMFSLSIFIIALLQLLLWSTKGNSFIFVELKEYVVEQSSNPYKETITASLRRAEYKNNSITNVIRYSTGWLELSLPDNNTVFKDAPLYTNTLVIAIIQLIPYLLLFLAVITHKKTEQKYKILIFFLMSLYVVQSKYFILFSNHFPYIDAFRWLSSKLWPSTLIATSILAGQLFPEFIKNTKYSNGRYLIPALLLIGFAPISIPFLNGTIKNKETRVIIPAEYYTLKTLSPDTSILVLPEPQNLYFRKYNWGYYGTDFISYLTNAEVLDNATNNTKKIAYFHLYLSNFQANICPKNHFFVLVDKTVTTSNILTIPPNYYLDKETAVFNLYSCVYVK